jgi:hypothetical protein
MQLLNSLLLLVSVYVLSVDTALTEKRAARKLITLPLKQLPLTSRALHPEIVSVSDIFISVFPTGSSTAL